MVQCRRCRMSAPPSTRSGSAPWRAASAATAAAGLIPGAQLVVGRSHGVAFEHAAGVARRRRPRSAASRRRVAHLLHDEADRQRRRHGPGRARRPAARRAGRRADPGLRAPARRRRRDGSPVPAAAARDRAGPDAPHGRAGLRLPRRRPGRAGAGRGRLPRRGPAAGRARRAPGRAARWSTSPARTWHYSHATEVLGRLVEVATGLRLGEALRALVLGPLGMADTGFLLPERDRARVAEPLPQPPGARPRFFDPCVPAPPRERGRRPRVDGRRLRALLPDAARPRHARRRAGARPGRRGADDGRPPRARRDRAARR